MKTRSDYELFARKYGRIEFYKCFLYFKKIFSTKPIILTYAGLLFALVSLWCLDKYVFPGSTLLFVILSIIVLASIIVIFILIVIPIFSALIIPILVYLTGLLSLLFWGIHCVVLDMAKFLDLDKVVDMRNSNETQ